MNSQTSLADSKLRALEGNQLSAQVYAFITQHKDLKHLGWEQLVLAIEPDKMIDLGVLLEPQKDKTNKLSFLQKLLASTEYQLTMLGLMVAAKNHLTYELFAHQDNADKLKLLCLLLNQITYSHYMPSNDEQRQGLEAYKLLSSSYDKESIQTMIDRLKASDPDLSLLTADGFAAVKLLAKNNKIREILFELIKDSPINADVYYDFIPYIDSSKAFANLLRALIKIDNEDALREAANKRIEREKLFKVMEDDIDSWKKVRGAIYVSDLTQCLTKHNVTDPVIINQLFETYQYRVTIESVHNIVTMINSLGITTDRGRATTFLYQIRGRKGKSLLATYPDVSPLDMIFAIIQDDGMRDIIIKAFISANQGKMNLAVFEALTGYYSSPISRQFFVNDYFYSAIDSLNENERFDAIKSRETFISDMPLDKLKQLRLLLPHDQQSAFDHEILKLPIEQPAVAITPVVTPVTTQPISPQPTMFAPFTITPKPEDPLQAFKSELSDFKRNFTAKLTTLFETLTWQSNDAARSRELIRSLLKTENYFEWKQLIEAEWETVTALQYPNTTPLQTTYQHLNSVPEKDAGNERTVYITTLRECNDLLAAFYQKHKNFLPNDSQINNGELAISRDKLAYLNESISDFSKYANALSDNDPAKAQTTQIAEKFAAEANQLTEKMPYTEFRKIANQLIKTYEDNISFLATPRDNSWKHIVANIALALTVVGFIAQIVNKVTNDRMFFFFDRATTREKHADQISESIRTIIKKE